MSSILIAEDNTAISAFVEKGLRAAGYQTDVVADGEQALTWAQLGSYDLMILDIGLPGIDGFELLARLRGQGSTLPVIILSARDAVTDRVLGLEGGADDYVTKPFQFAELLARVRLRLRDSAVTAEAPSGSVLRVSDMQLDLRTRRVTLSANGTRRDVALTSREFALLEVFMRHPGHVLSREQLMGHVWGLDLAASSNVVDVCVRAVRAKIGRERIETVRGSGYRLREHPDDSPA